MALTSSADCIESLVVDVATETAPNLAITLIKLQNRL